MPERRGHACICHPCLCKCRHGASNSNRSPLEGCPVRESVPVRVVPVPSWLAEFGPFGARASAKIVRAYCWGTRSVLPSEPGATCRCSGRGQPYGAELRICPTARLWLELTVTVRSAEATGAARLGRRAACWSATGRDFPV